MNLVKLYQWRKEHGVLSPEQDKRKARRRYMAIHSPTPVASVFHRDGGTYKKRHHKEP